MDDDITTIADLHIDERNARKRGLRASGMLEASLQEVGAARSIVIDEAGNILAGNGTVEAAGQVGIERVQVVEADGETLVAVRRRGLSPEQKRRLALLDNRTGELAEWDTEVLAELAQEGVPLDDLWSEEELDALLAGLQEQGGLLPDADPDAIPEDAPTRCKAGDMWRLGEHRVLCGDSTKREEVERLLAGAKPNLMVTDPPYGVQLDPTWRDDGANRLAPSGKGSADYMESGASDTEMDWPDVWKNFPGDVCYIWCGDKQMLRLPGPLSEAGFDIRQVLVWTKTLTMTRTHYWCSHEFCPYAVRHGKASGWVGDGGQSSVWDEASPKHIMSGSKEESLHHPAQKPLECMARPIRNHTGDVFDPFLGSGTTLIAAEKHGRRCFGMEISEKFCDLIISRWEKCTGKTAELTK